MELMEFGITLLFTMGNVCLNMGVVFGVFLLLRPLLVRIVTPQQRVWLWYVFWYSALFFTAWGCISYHRVLPVTVWDLLGVSAARSYELFRGPLFLPPDYDGPGTYALTLPGGVRVPIALTDTLCLAVAAVYLAGVVCLAVWMVRRALALRRLGQQGTRTEVGLWSDFGKPKEEPDAPDTCPVWLAPNLPTSFALWNAIYLQEELPPERRRLVLLHELDHLCLRHGIIKGYMSFALIAGWWNPLIWLGYRYTCLDMELACRQDHGAPLPPGAAGVRPDSGGAGLRPAAVGRAPGLRGERRGAPGEGPAGLEAPDHPPKTAGPVRGGAGHVPLSGHALGHVWSIGICRLCGTFQKNREVSLC